MTWLMADSALYVMLLADSSKIRSDVDGNIAVAERC